MLKIDAGSKFSGSAEWVKLLLTLSGENPLKDDVDGTEIQPGSIRQPPEHRKPEINRFLIIGW
jgi:hypothetical protein